MKNQMLRISEKNEAKRTKVLFLEGKICQPWVNELQVEIRKALDEGKKIILDFSKVSFLDEEAASMISQSSRQKVEKRNCSLFIRSMLRIESERGK